MSTTYYHDSLQGFLSEIVSARNSGQTLVSSDDKVDRTIGFETSGGNQRHCVRMTHIIEKNLWGVFPPEITVGAFRIWVSTPKSRQNFDTLFSLTEVGSK